MADSYKSKWTGAEVDAGIDAVRELVSLDIPTVLKNKADNSKVSALEKQIQELQKQLEINVSGPMKLPVYDNITDVPVNDGYVSLFGLIDSDKSITLCGKTAYNIVKLAPITITDSETLQLSIMSPTITITSEN